jgi:hypothetical protein
MKEGRGGKERRGKKWLGDSVKTGKVKEEIVPVLN